MNASHITSKNYSISGRSDLVLKLYHMTDEIGVAGIHDIQMMKISKDGMLGKGIYFAETPQEASDKAEHKGIVLEVLVRVGWMIVLTRESNHGLTLDKVRAVGCDSVKSVRHNTGPEYVVYDPDQVIAAWAISGIPDAPQVVFPGPERDSRTICTYDGKCACHDPQHFITYKHKHPPIFQMRAIQAEQRPACPSGAGCAIKAVEHFKEYSHPAIVSLPAIPREDTPKPYRIPSQEEFMRMQARRIYDVDTDDEADGYKEACPYGERCPYNDNLDHFTTFRHPENTTFMTQCELGERCTDMSEEHRREFSHKKRCGYGAECPFVDEIEHCLEFCHPEGTVVKMPCRKGLRCTNRSEEHMRLYSHKK